MSGFASSYVCQQLLAVINRTIDSKSPWFGTREDQIAVLNRVFTIVMPELKSKSQVGGTDEVKTFLNENQTSLDLPDTIGSSDVCAAVILSICVKWQNVGIEEKITKNGKNYDGACLPASIYKSPEGCTYSSVPLVNGDTVIFEQKTNVFSTIQEMEENGLLFAGYNSTNNLYQYDGLIFPQVDLDVSRDFYEIKNISVSNPDYVLAVVKGRCQLQMNHLGAKLKMASGGNAFEECVFTPQYWIIDDTFCVHFVREGEVYASVLVTPEHFHKVEIDFD
jgi:hypothetical protein